MRSLTAVLLLAGAPCKRVNVRTSVVTSSQRTFPRISHTRDSREYLASKLYMAHDIVTMTERNQNIQ